MKLIKLKKPNMPQNGDAIFGIPIAPLDRLKTFSDKQFEEMIDEWACDYLQSKYKSVHLFGGPGDKGRDIVAYLDDTRNVFDIYQCKHYDNPITPSEYWIEFGKLCYFTYVGEYNLPQEYYIVASQGVGQKLRDYVENPTRINKDLIINWDKCCKTKITKTKEIALDAGLKQYINNFDFSIVKDIDPLKLIDQYSHTKWYKYRFGGGLKKRPKVDEPPDTISEDEKKLLYIKQLLMVYSEYSSGQINDLENLTRDNILFDHFMRQRKDYYCAQSLKRFSRDEFIDDPYNESKDEILRSVIDTSLKEYTSSLDRVNTTLSEARKVSLDGNELGKINPSDKSGMCHELVNDQKLKWVK